MTTEQPLNALIIEDSQSDALLLVRALRKGGYDVHFERVEEEDSLRQALKKRTWDIIFSDHSMPRLNSLTALGMVQDVLPDIPFIIISGTIGEEAAVGAMKAGASDYMLKDNLARLIPAVQREIADSRMRMARRRAEEELKISEARFQRLMATNLTGIVLSDLDTGMIIEANDAFLTMVGYTRSELLSARMTLHALTAEGRRQDGEDGGMPSLGGAIPLENRLVRKDGTMVEVYLGGTLLDEGKNQNVTFVLDISERVNAERQLQKTLARERLIKRIVEVANSTYPIDSLLNIAAEELRRFFDVDSCVLLRYDDDTWQSEPIVTSRLKEWQPENREKDNALPQGFLPYLNRVLMSRQPDRFFCFANVDELMAEVHESLRTMGIPESMNQVLHDLLFKYHIQSGIKVEIEHQGIPYGVISLYHGHKDGKACHESRDVLHNIAMHLGEALYQTELYQQAVAAKEEAEEANRKKSQFLATVSHELRTPLNAIIGYSQMLETGYGGGLNGKQERYTHNILNSGYHLLDMVEELLDVSRIEAGKLNVLKQEVDLIALLAELKPMFEQRAAIKHLKTHFEIAPDVHYLRVDPPRLRQILINLMSNAVKFNREGGSIRLDVYYTEDGRWIQFDMTDTGIGIPEDKQKNLFREFYQIDNSYSRSEEGLGLGLALTKRLVELHGGTIEVVSRPDVGSTFSFRLPRL